MRILLVSDVPLMRELGGGRVQLETAEELRRLGHSVQHSTPTMHSAPRADGASDGLHQWRSRVGQPPLSDSVLPNSM